MKEPLSIAQIIKPEHQKILENQDKYSFEEVMNAKKQAKYEMDEAQSAGITVEELRQQKQQALQEISQKIKAQEEATNKLRNADIETFGDTCFYFLMKNCEQNGSIFKTDVEKDMKMYREIIRYFYWDGKCKILDKKRNLYLFGVYGCGKSITVKSMLQALNYHRRNNWQYIHLPTVIKNFLAGVSSGKKHNDAFETLFTSTKNLIIDEIGDKTEKQKYFGNEIESVRSLILDKYDKWVSNNQHPNAQRIVFTSNLFPDQEYFFTKLESDHRPTLRNFYDEKVYNKMGEMCNLVRFPNISYRVNNKIEML